MAQESKKINISVFCTPLEAQSILKEAIKRKEITEEEALKIYNNWREKRKEQFKKK